MASDPWLALHGVYQIYSILFFYYRKFNLTKIHPSFCSAPVKIKELMFQGVKATWLIKDPLPVSLWINTDDICFLFPLVLRGL